MMSVDEKAETAKLAALTEDEWIERVSRWIFLAARSSTFGRYDALCRVAYEANERLYDRAFAMARRLVTG